MAGWHCRGARSGSPAAHLRLPPCRKPEPRLIPQPGEPLLVPAVMAGALPVLPSNCEPGSSRDTQALLRPSRRGALCAVAMKGFHPMHQIQPTRGTSPCARDRAAAMVAPSAGSQTLQTTGVLGTPASHHKLVVMIHQILTWK